MRALTPIRDSHSTLRRVVAALCVFLIILVGVAQILHSHPASESADACSLCAVAHLAALPAAFAARPVVAEQLRPFLESAPATGPPRFAHGSFTIRPPPALNPHA
jgi:hypothetical protein